GIHRDVVAARLREEVGRAANLAAQAAGVVLQASAGVLLTVVVAMWTMFYVLRDWPRIARHLERLLPLDPVHTRALVDEFRHVGRRAFVGSVAGAIVQGAIASIGFVMFGVPQPITWGAILAILAFIPVIGTLLVWVPAAVWLLTSGHLIRALLLTAYSLLFVMALNDYVIRPRLVGRADASDGGQDAHPLLTLVSLIGGISLFGIAGVIVGPIIMSLFVASARIYERERAAELSDTESRDPQPPRT
ncbi:MAG: AI-2E family transporter, partial [Polyangiaceae bacterium]